MTVGQGTAGSWHAFAPKPGAHPQRGRASATFPGNLRTGRLRRSVGRGRLCLNRPHPEPAGRPAGCWLMLSEGQSSSLAAGFTAGSERWPEGAGAGFPKRRAAAGRARAGEARGVQGASEEERPSQGELLYGTKAEHDGSASTGVDTTPGAARRRRGQRPGSLRAVTGRRGGRSLTRVSSTT